ncbi:MAG: DUF1570 domain-containing protein [Terriglobia bacterium]
MRVRLAYLSLGLLLAAAGLLQAKKKPEWIEGHSSHFHVISNAKPKKVQKVTQKLEEFRHLFSSMFPGLRLDPPVPTTVLFFKNDKSMRPYKPLTPKGKPKRLAGFFQPGPERMYLAVNLGTRNAQRTTFHEYVHLMLQLNFERLPLWLDEGLAEFYERTDLHGAKFTLGYPQVNYWSVLRNSKLIPLDVLVKVNHQSDYYNEPKKRTLFYGQSWLLVHYLIAGKKGKRQKQFAGFTRLLRQDVPQDAAFGQAFSMTYQQMQRQLQSYLRQLNVNYFRGRLSKPPAKEEPVELRPIDTALAQAYLADLWINQGRVAEAEQALQQLTESGTAPAEVRYRLGRIALARRQPQQAAEHFRAALATRPDDISLRYYAALAVSLGRLAAATDTEERRTAATEVIAYLSPVLEAQTEFVHAYDLYIQARLVRNDPPEQLTPVVERARHLMPQRHEFDLLLLHLYMRQRRWKEAETAAQRLLQGSAPADQRRQAEEWLERLRTARQLESEETQAARQSQSNLDPKAASARFSRTAPVEPPPTPAPAEPPKMRYLRGTLVNVACSGDAAVLTIQEKSKKGKTQKTIRLAVPSRARVVVLGSGGGQKLECEAKGVPVAVNYRVQPAGADIAGVVMTIAFYPPER